MLTNSATIAEHVMEYGEPIVLNGVSYIAQLRRMSFKQVAELGAEGEIRHSLTLPRVQCDEADYPFYPVIGMSLTLNDDRYEIVDIPIDNPDYYRLTLMRYGR